MTEPEYSIFKELQKTWTPFFNGVTAFYEAIVLTLRKIRSFSLRLTPCAMHQNHTFGLTQVRITGEA